MTPNPPPMTTKKAETDFPISAMYEITKHGYL